MKKKRCHAFERAGRIFSGSFSIRNEHWTPDIHSSSRFAGPQGVSALYGAASDAEGKPGYDR